MVARSKVSNTRFQYSIKAVETKIKLDSNLNSVVEDVTSDIAKTDIILNWLALYLM